jgi:hypothetical protein
MSSEFHQEYLSTQLQQRTNKYGHEERHVTNFSTANSVSRLSEDSDHITKQTA